MAAVGVGSAVFDESREKEVEYQYAPGNAFEGGEAEQLPLESCFVSSLTVLLSYFDGFDGVSASRILLKPRRTRS